MQTEQPLNDLNNMPLWHRRAFIGALLASASVAGARLPLRAIVANAAQASATAPANATEYTYRRLAKYTIELTFRINEDTADVQLIRKEMIDENGNVCNDRSMLPECLCATHDNKHNDGSPISGELA